MIDTSTSRVAYTSESAVEACGNRYLLVIAAATRYRELRDGNFRRVKTTAGNKIAALQELEAGVFGFQKFVSKTK